MLQIFFLQYNKFGDQLVHRFQEITNHLSGVGVHCVIINFRKHIVDSYGDLIMCQN